MTTPRRDFINWLGASTVFAAAGSPRLQEHPDDLVPVADTWDLSWVDRVNGKFRAVFDSPELSGGAGLWRAHLWRDQYKEVYATERSQTSAVLVVRHSAIPLVMNDAFWGAYPAGKNNKLKNPATKKWFTTNPLLTNMPGARPEEGEYRLDSFLKSGGIVLACNLAFQSVIGTVAAQDKLKQPEATAKAKQMLVPGVILQPSGVFAVLRAQEAGCNYILAS